MTEEEIITTIEVTSGTTDDHKQLMTLFEQSREAGIEVTEIIADTAYSDKHSKKPLHTTKMRTL